MLIERTRLVADAFDDISGLLIELGVRCPWLACLRLVAYSSCHKASERQVSCDAGRASRSRGSWNPGILDDPRVVEYWDDAGVVSRWFFEHQGEIGFEFRGGGGAVWDSSLLFGPDASWGSVPFPIEHFGYTVIRRADGLKDHLDELWAIGS